MKIFWKILTGTNGRRQRQISSGRNPIKAFDQSKPNSPVRRMPSGLRTSVSTTAQLLHAVIKYTEIRSARVSFAKFLPRPKFCHSCVAYVFTIRLPRLGAGVRDLFPATRISGLNSFVATFDIDIARKTNMRLSFEIFQRK